MQQEAIRRLMLEAERQENIAASAAKIPQDESEVVVKDEAVAANGVPLTFPTVQPNKPLLASRLRPLSGSVSVSKEYRTVAPVSRVLKSTSSPLSVGKPFSDPQVPSRRAGPTAPTTVRSAGIVTSRPLSSRSAVGASTKPTVAEKLTRTGK